MKYNTTYYNTTVDIDNVLEIRIEKDRWDKIVKAAKLRDSSYSWVVRYCLFRLIKRKNLYNLVRFDKRNAFAKKWNTLNENIKNESKTAKQFHRHMLCLYGKDELRIRITAAQFECSMTHLIRVALEWNLDHLIASVFKKGRFVDCAFYWLGIKHFIGVEFHTYDTQIIPIFFQKYEYYNYWPEKITE